MDLTKNSSQSPTTEEELDAAQVFEASLLTRHKMLDTATESGLSRVQQLYRGTTVFITGGSGFLGKQLIDKLCRATDVAKIFILLRPKKGKPIQERLEEMLIDPVYDLVRKQRPDFTQKLVPVKGDVAELKLGLSDEDWKTVTEQTNIIFHVAATTRFDEALRVATLINIRGTREALTLGKACAKLRSFVHVSTAYSHAKENLIKTDVLEDFYPSPVDPEAMIRLVNATDEERLNDITANLIKGWPNTYCFGKAISEELVHIMGRGMPICIVRPAIVICARREPSPGWIDMSCIYGASGITLGSTLGVMHTVYASEDAIIALTPVDYVNNAIIVAGWETAMKQEEKIKIYTVTTSTRNGISWGQIAHTVSHKCRQFFSPAVMWYAFSFCARHPPLFFIYSCIMHFIPGYVLDGICLIFGKKRTFVKLYTKMYKMGMALSYFTVNSWRFDDTNTEQLFESLSPIDQEIFEFDVKKIDWVEYVRIWVIGLRKYVIKDGLRGTACSLKKQFVLKILTFLLVPIYLYGLYKLFCFCIMYLTPLCLIL